MGPKHMAQVAALQAAQAMLMQQPIGVQGLGCQCRSAGTSLLCRSTVAFVSHRMRANERLSI